MADEKTALFGGSSGATPASASAAVDISKSDDAFAIKEIDVKEIDAGAAASSGGGSSSVAVRAAEGATGGGATVRPHTPLPFTKPGKAAYFWLWFKYLVVITIPTYSCYVLAHTSSTVLSLTVHADTSKSDFTANLCWYAFISVFPMIVIITLTQLILDSLSRQFLFYRFLEFGYLIRYAKSANSTWSSLFFYFLCASCALFGYYFFQNVPDHTDELGTIVCAQFAGLLLFYTFIVNSTQSFVSVHDFFAVGDGSAAVRFMTGLERIEESEVRALCATKLASFSHALRTKATCCGDNRGLIPLQSFQSWAAGIKVPQPPVESGCWNDFWVSSECWALRFVLGAKSFMDDHEDVKISNLFSTCSMVGVLFPLCLQIIVTILKLFLGDDWIVDGN